MRCIAARHRLSRNDVHGHPSNASLKRHLGFIDMGSISFVRANAPAVQFRLATLLGIVTVISMALAVWTARERSYQARLHAVSVLRASGQVCEIGIGDGPHSGKRASGHGDFDWALGDRAGVGDYDPSDTLERDDVVTHINACLWDGAFSDEQISAILCFPTLKSLDLSISCVKDRQLAEIAKLPLL